MTWVRLDDQFPHHPKVVTVGPLGIAMQIVGLCYCNQFLTDGFIPTSAIPTFMDFTELDANAFNGRGGVCWIAVQKLLDAGIWEEAEGGYQIHDYLEYQPSKASIEAERERNRVAGQHSAQRRVQQGVQHLPNTMSTQSRSRSQEKEKEPLSTEVRKKGATGGVTPFVLPEWVNQTLWGSFMEMRKTLKAKNTPNAMALLTNELERLRADGNNPDAVIERSIMNSWKGVFPLKNGGINGSKPIRKPGPNPTPYKESKPYPVYRIPEGQPLLGR